MTTTTSQQPRILHLGLGAFHRAHQALYTDLANQNSDVRWQISSVNLFDSKLTEQLASQNYQYRLLEQHETGPQLKTISSITEALCPITDGYDTIMARMTHPDTAIISLTVTEKGYCQNIETGGLDVNNKLIKYDLENPQSPKSAIGYIVEAIRLRREEGTPAFTVMSCDNLQGNGEVARQVVIEFAELLYSELAEWISKEVNFSSTMVDRIVPAVTDETLAEIERMHGSADLAGLACEGFRQWVIEDKFSLGRPPWDLAGAQLVKDVQPFEEAKLRLLNGSHSFLAYLGLLAGYQTIYEAVNDESYRSAVRTLMNDVMATSLTNPPEIDLASYAEQLITRFSNPNIRHKTAQIASDGSKKIPQRWIPALQAHQGNPELTRWIALGIAGWIRHLNQQDDQQQTVPVTDPMKEELIALTQTHGSGVELVDACLDIASIFPLEVVNSEIRQQIHKAYQLLESGSKTTVQALVNGDQL